MASNKERRLFGEFPEVTTTQWEEVIAADLKGADYDRKLVWRTREGFSVRPYYRAEDLAGIKYLGAGPGEFPYVRGTRTDNRWLVYQTVTVGGDTAGANREAIAAIAGGADAIGFVIGRCEFSAADMDTLMRGIDPAVTEVTFGGSGLTAVAALVPEYVAKAGVDPAAVRINIAFDPLCKRFAPCADHACGAGGKPCFAEIGRLAEVGKAYRKMRIVTVGGHNFGDAGATIVEELAFTLAAGHEYMVQLMDAGLDAAAAAHSIRFSMGVSSNYFMEIAKLRAARMLWAMIVRQYAPERACAEKMMIHAVSSRWNMTVYDPHVNMLRGTTEAMSAATGGVHSMEVLPFDAVREQTAVFPARIARNVQLLLKHESHFDNVTDPSGGSYYIENLTESIAAKSWELFREVEELGGYIAAFRTGFIGRRIEASAAQKATDVATRKIVLLGTNQYPNFNEVADGAAAGTAARGATPFEEMRLRVDRSGRNPKVFMLTCGTLGMARARSQFAGNFFGCAGFRIQDNTFFSSVREGVEAAIASKAEIVVICSADDDYETLAPEAYRLLDGRAIFVVAGAPKSQPQLEEQGITNFISVRSNVLATLTQYVKELGICE